MAEYIDREKMLKYIEDTNTADEWIVGQYNADWIYSFIESQPTADVEEKKDCEKCIHFGKHATEYPCSHCRNCYTDKFQPNDTRTPKERGGESEKKSLKNGGIKGTKFFKSRIIKNLGKK